MPLVRIANPRDAQSAQTVEGLVRIIGEALGCGMLGCEMLGCGDDAADQLGGTALKSATLVRARCATT